MKHKELEALKCAANGLTVHETAMDMCLSRSSIEKLLVSARERLSAKNTANAIYKACKAGLLCYAVLSMTSGVVDVERRHRRNGRREVYEYQFVSQNTSI